MSKEHLNFRNLVLLAFSLLIIAGFFYKYYELKTLNELVNFQREKYSQEISLDSDNNKLEVKFNPLIVNYATNSADPKTPSSYVISLIDELKNAISLINNSYSSALSVYKENRDLFTKIKNKSILLFGKSRQYKNDLVVLLDDYYRFNIDTHNKSITDDNLLSNLLIIWKDRTILNDYNKKISQNVEAYAPKYFADIASLEKYTNTDYKFIDQENVKSSHPYGFDYLDKSKTYMGSYYLLVKDYYLGDAESAQYKASRLDKVGSELNVDFDRLFDEGKDKVIERNTKYLETLIKLFALSKRIKADDYNSIFGRLNSLNDNLILCALYASKIGLYNNILSKYPSATTSAELIKELSGISPKTAQADSLIYNDIVNFKITDKSITLVCNDKENKKSYTFEAIK